MTVYKINDWGDQVNMKLTVDWNHPDTEASIREMSMFWAGHPGKADRLIRHKSFPAAIRLPTSENGGHPRWVAREVKKFLQ